MLEIDAIDQVVGLDFPKSKITHSSMKIVHFLVFCELQDDHR